MTISAESLVAFVGLAAAVSTAVIVLFRWAEDQDRLKHEQLRRDVANEIRAEFYQHLLELNVAWLSSTPQQRETLTGLTEEAKSQLRESQDTSSV